MHIAPFDFTESYISNKYILYSKKIILFIKWNERMSICGLLIFNVNSVCRGIQTHIGAGQQTNSSVCPSGIRRIVASVSIGIFRNRKMTFADMSQQTS